MEFSNFFVSASFYDELLLFLSAIFESCFAFKWLLSNWNVNVIFVTFVLAEMNWNDLSGRGSQCLHGHMFLQVLKLKSDWLTRLETGKHQIVINVKREVQPTVLSVALFRAPWPLCHPTTFIPSFSDWGGALLVRWTKLPPPHPFTDLPVSIAIITCFF